MKKRMNMYFSLLAVSGGTALLCLGACSRAEEAPRGEPVDFSRPARNSGSQLQFNTPDGWVEEDPSSSFRRAQYRLPGREVGAGDAELAVFSDIGGTVEQNIERWVGQFTIADGQSAEDSAIVTKKEINGFSVTIVDVAGTYQASMMGPRVPEAKENYRMLATVIETEETPWFLKLVGPQETVARWEESFTAFVHSVRSGR